MLGPHGADMSLVGNISQLGDTISVFVSQSALFEPDGGQQSKRMQNRLHRKAGIHGEVSSSSGVVTGMILMNVDRVSMGEHEILPQSIVMNCNRTARL